MAIPEDDWQTKATDELLATIVRLGTVEEAAAFMRDLCTRKELEEMSHRWEAVKLLDQGIPYREISDRTGLSTATITRINQWLQHGTGGYRQMLTKIEEST
ncbi:MAG TPA: YerC/YecD family TrpR-related protein [Acidimicrobiia bacterium]|jgi:TrpR-related protein YerC/YecD